jgi:hypothetical protein
VRGTVWTTTDRCDGTLTNAKDTVLVRDLVRHIKILLHPHQHYLRRASIPRADLTTQGGWRESRLR